MLFHIIPRVTNGLFVSSCTLVVACTSHGSAGDNASPHGTGTGGTEASSGVTTGSEQTTMAEATSTLGGPSTESSGVADSGGEVDGTTTESAPTGPVWVDASGSVVGYFREVSDWHGDAHDGLAELDRDVRWRVHPDRSSVGPVDPTFGVAYYASVDCSGPALFTELATLDGFRPGIVTSAIGPGNVEVIFVVPLGTEPVAAEFGSWWREGYGCQSVDPLDDNFGEFYREADVLLVQPPEFIPPLSVEQH